MDSPKEYSLHVDFRAVLALDDLVARVCLDDGSEQRVVLRNGQFSGVFPARPVRLFLTTDSVPEGESPLVQRLCSESPREGGTGPLIEFEELFRIGMVIPANGMLSARLIWGTGCHLHHGGTSLLERYNNPQTPSDGGRFLGSEHIKCAERIGKDESRIRPLQVEGHKAFFNAETKLPCGPRKLTFGQILALGGDLYAFLDRDSLNDYTRSWPEPSGVTWLLDWDYREPPLLEDHSNAVEDTLATFERELAKLLASQDPGGIWDEGSTSYCRRPAKRRASRIPPPRFSNFTKSSSEPKTRRHGDEPPVAQDGDLGLLLAQKQQIDRSYRRHRVHGAGHRQTQCIPAFRTVGPIGWSQRPLRQTPLLLRQ